MATLFSDIVSLLTRIGILAERPRFALAVIRVSLVVLGLAYFGSSRANATCGDWLAHPNDAGVDQSTPAETPAATAGRHESPRPCSGPFCGRTPTAPAAPAPIQVPTASDQLLAALANSSVAVATDRDSALSLVSHAAPQAGFARRIDHPPQA